MYRSVGAQYKGFGTGRQGSGCGENFWNAAIPPPARAQTRVATDGADSVTTGNHGDFRSEKYSISTQKAKPKPGQVLKVPRSSRTTATKGSIEHRSDSNGPRRAVVKVPNMADPSQLEADLLAALGVAPLSELTPFPEVKTEADPAQRPPGPPDQPQSAADEAPSSFEHHAAPSPLLPISSLFPPRAVPLPPPTNDDLQSWDRPQDHVDPLDRPAPPGCEGMTEYNREVTDAISAALTPLDSSAFFPHSPRTSPPPPPPATATAPSELPLDDTRPPKRSRSPDEPDDDGSAKRKKTEQDEEKVRDRGPAAPNVDLAAMLHDALADFDQQADPEGSSDVTMQDVGGAAQPTAPAAVAVPAAAAASATPEAERPENKIMKASANPFHVMRCMSLPVLGNVAVQILLRLSQQPRAETAALLAADADPDSDSDFRKAYDMLLAIFRPTRAAFSDATPLLSPDELEITDSEDRETIRMANLAATAASAFGAQDVPLEDVHEAFFAVFIPEDGEYKASLTELLVCLKTRLLLDTLNKPDQPQTVARLLDALFPVNFEDTLKQRSGESVLSPDEEALVSQVRERRELLVRSAADEPIKSASSSELAICEFSC